MHRATPLGSSFRAFSAGGGRSVIPEVDDSKFMQESTNSRGMASEQHPTMEAPQNYGFTSVVADADKSSNPGEITASAEGFISYMGGNRSFPVMGVMDDRRHRLLNLAKDAAKGATAMFGLQKWGQQLLNTEDGWFMTGNNDKKMRLQLVKNKNGQQQEGGGGSGGGGGASSREARAGDGGGGSSGGGASGGQSGGQQKGQKSLHKEKSETYVDMTKEAVHTVRGSGNVKATDPKTLTYHKDEDKSTRCDAQHVHIRFGGSNIWVDASGCWCSTPIRLRTCSDSNSTSRRTGEGVEGTEVEGTVPGPIQSGPPAYFTDPPLSIDADAKLTLAYRAPLIVDPAAKLTVDWVPHCGVLQLGTASPSATLKFVPYAGHHLKIDGVFYKIPAGGITIPSTNVMVNGVPGISLDLNTYYYLYLYHAGAGVLAPDFRIATEGVIDHAPSATAGNEGVEIRIGDDSRSLIGMVCTANSGLPNVFVSDLTTRYVRTWFNRARLPLNGTIDYTAATNVGSWAWFSAPVSWINWAGEMVTVHCSGSHYQTVAPSDTYLNLAIDRINQMVAGSSTRFAVTNGYQPMAMTHPTTSLSELGVHSATIGIQVSIGSSIGTFDIRGVVG